MTAPTDRILLILDLDETLVHASEKPLSREADFQALGYFVHVRPHLEPFLRECAARFRLAIWSAGADKYVAELVKRIVPPELELDFVWGRSRCTYGFDRGRYLKTLADVDNVRCIEKRNWRKQLCQD
ncbi:HAD family hydrolase [Corallococcus exiguus]|uniref:NIF family HAD-type phosphatase n=1 Tax=Corallococcus exiguus TaxID=83462 RepID=UPI0014718C43|nr:HAD family hydrolase [Corallococcus exiguus]NNC09178.1 HAD family hydrolase [Corallococcus exiguus]